jgi:flavin-dependent dehydrogenase
MSSVDRLESTYDVVIVGARCAGAGAALLLARQGARVLVIDRSARGDDTLSTLALMRGGVMQLHRWGVLDAVKQARTPAIRRTSFHYGQEVVEVPIKARDGVEALYAPRRTVLDALLVDAAERSGATVIHQTRLVDLTWRGEARVDGVIVQSRSGAVRRIGAGIVIGADGQRSTVARLVGAQPYRVGKHGSGVVYALWPWPERDANRWYYGAGVSVGTIPTNDGLSCVFVAVPAGRFAKEFRGALQEAYHRALNEGAPGQARALRGLVPASRFWGHPGVPGYFRQSWGPGWALVGDAGYFKDPITAHGITDALRDADLLARAVLDRSPSALAEYQCLRDDLSRGVFEISDRIASFEWSLDDVKELHHGLSQEMQREVVWLRETDTVTSLRVQMGAAS